MSLISMENKKKNDKIRTIVCVFFFFFYQLQFENKNNARNWLV